MNEITGTGMKNSLTLPSLANRYIDSLRGENDAPIYTYNDEKMQNFVRQSIKGRRSGSFYFLKKSTMSDEVFNVISKELDVNGIICEVLHQNFGYEIKRRKKNKTNMIHILKTTEILIKMKNHNMVIISLVNYRYTKNYKN